MTFFVVNLTESIADVTDVSRYTLAGEAKGCRGINYTITAIQTRITCARIY